MPAKVPANVSGKGLKIAVIGSGISGLSCAWLLSQQHNVTLFEKDDRFGGHSHTALIPSQATDSPTDSPESEQVKTTAVDTGFIVFNEKTYPNLTAFFQHLQVPVVLTDMSFSVSLNRGRLEYSGTGLKGLFAQPSNLLKPGFWKMLLDLLRFYRNSEGWLASLEPGNSLEPSMTLRELLEKEQFGKPFIRDHLIPMGAAIWSTPADKMLDYPALAFLRFCHNHGLLQLSNRPQWQTVKGGSREYVKRITDQLKDSALTNCCIRKVRRFEDRVEITDIRGQKRSFDQVVMACHADTSLELLKDPDELEQLLLGAFQFQRNKAYLHSDKRLMPKNKKAWASWNYLGTTVNQGPSVSYWMNRLQHLPGESLFVTLNPEQEPETAKIHGCYLYDHPVFDQNALNAQQRVWELQGRNRTWYCGAWMGYGFHEDGIQSGLAVAESLGGIQRPWQVDNENDRLCLPESPAVMT